jgi:RNA-directed DNA polymerase
MLWALENGVQGGVWFSLIDKVSRPATLQEAWRRVAANGGAAGVDHQTVEGFRRREAAEVEQLAEELRTGRYTPRAIRRHYIPKPGSNEKRPLGIPTVRDRVVQAAVRMVIEPIFEREFAANSYGFRPGRGCKEALREVDRMLKDGRCWVVDADLNGYFDSIPHDRLMDRVEERTQDGRVLDLVRAFLRPGVLEDGRVRANEQGSPQGGVISPLLANLYLNPLDHTRIRQGHRMVRYADDLVILCATEAEAQAALQALDAWVVEEGLTLHPAKTRIVNVSQPGEGFDFLGYHFERTRRGRLTRWPRRKSLRKYKERIRELTHRANGHGMPTIIERCNGVARGWHEYFRHSQPAIFATLDGWTRQRLRAILRKRRGGRGRGRGRDHQRWTNAYFAGLGFFSMQEAHAGIPQSSR